MCGYERLDLLALEYLKRMSPENTIIDVSDDIVLKWTNPDFGLDGLLFDETENSFYVIVEEDFSGDDKKLFKIEATLDEFRKFITQDKPICKNGCLSCRKKIGRWIQFFDKDSGCIIREDEKRMYTKIFVLNRIIRQR